MKVPWERGSKENFSSSEQANVSASDRHGKISQLFKLVRKRGKSFI